MYAMCSSLIGLMELIAVIDMPTAKQFSLMLMKRLDGIQGQVYVGTGCVFIRQALYGYGPPSLPGLPTASPPYCSWFGKRSSKEPSKDPSEVYRDAKEEELDAGIFNLKEIESKSRYEDE